ncbi:minichromosome maintenance domain-containing protein 2-like [Brevipalpus obovatus]|uniref:minichromosome maintenance domain-containing protein 2-like n=1 Tax=Brevipalpus obovatus TaxID=246614 RepID=UPI003D9DFE1B
MRLIGSTTFRAFFYDIVDPRMYKLAKLGARIKSIEGIAMCWETVSGVREVGIDVLTCDFENPFQMVRDPCGPRDYSAEISRLRSINAENSPSSLAFALSEYFAIDILGKGNLMLKMCFLISLMALRSKGEEKNEYIRHKSIMVVGNYLYRVRTLFAFASKFAHNHFIHSSQVSVSVVARKNKNTFWNDAGSLQLATNGVCVIDAQKVSEKDHNDLVAILEHNKFPIKVDKNQSSREETLNIAIWVSQSLELCQQTGKNKPIPLSLFPLVIRCEEDPSSRGESPLLQEDWAQLFTLASHVELIFTKEAKDILENYFFTARNRLRDKCDRLAISHLMTSAIALAKLCLRHHVLSFDAILAISLFEESCLIKYGASILYGTDFPRFERLVQLFQEKGGSRHIDDIRESLEKNLDSSFDDSEMNEE